MKFFPQLIVTTIITTIISAVPVITQAANIRGSAIFGVPDNVELGNFVTLTFTADQPITLDSFSFDFSGSNTIIDNTGFGVTPPDFSDVNAFSNNILNDHQFTSTLNGFESGETVVYTFDFDQASTLTGTPLGRDYLNGSIDVTFSDGTNLNFPILETDFLEGTADFYHNDFHGLSFIKPELREIIAYLRENDLVILVEEESSWQFERFQNFETFETSATTPEPSSLFTLLLTGVFGFRLVFKPKMS